MAELNELFADETMEPTEPLNEQVEGGEDEVSEEVEEPEVSEEGAEGNEEEVDENSIEYWKTLAQKKEQELRQLQSKKDREIWELQKRLDELEQKITGATEQTQQVQEELDPEEIRDLFFENPAAAVKKIVETIIPEILEKTLPKVEQKRSTMKQQEVITQWHYDVATLERLPDYREIVKNPEHPLMKAMAEFIAANKDKYLESGNTNLVPDALAYAKKKVKVKRENPAKKKSSIVGKKSGATGKTEPRKLLGGVLKVNSLFADEE